MVTRLEKYESFPLPDKLNSTLANFSYVFNPSFIAYENMNYMAIRVFDDQLQTIIALLFMWDDEASIQQINLSEYFSKHLSFIKVADPKLFIMDNKVYGTFNTGDASKEPNQLMLIELSSFDIKSYKYCDYNERMRTEKNWAFYTENNELYALYSLNPLTILKGSKINNSLISFEKYYCDENQNFNNYSVGTPLLKLGDTYCFLAHKKYYRKRKRLYLGRMCELSTMVKPKLKVSKPILIHSFYSLLGNKHKFNKNLISCTYFSGIHKLKDKLILSYGVNDVSWNVKIIKESKIWQ
ncbi:hypothetical protein M8845_03765 [Gelidibacter japonicus]|uniref:hypothetical protein n=1 Tax=Gelidibacter japonicus TaxID=1962232 RepID=UPI00201FCB3A|nr:hypothetical protein [Gelidibacter japonicus]MCL8006538.1 hypothetical protein [Gelidibacter japonicus]